jgi:predicted metallo-beta-lactamase superfamily hydrolase
MATMSIMTDFVLQFVMQLSYRGVNGCKTCGELRIHEQENYRLIIQHHILYEHYWQGKNSHVNKKANAETCQGGIIRSDNHRDVVSKQETGAHERCTGAVLFRLH